MTAHLILNFLGVTKLAIVGQIKMPQVTMIQHIIIPKHTSSSTGHGW